MKISICKNSDVTKAVRYALNYARELEFSKTKVNMIATAVSELARNIYQHAGEGEIIFGIKEKGGKKGIKITAKDKGIGIPDINLALQDHYSSKGSLGIGLPGTNRLMDEFEIESVMNKGTVVTIVKWM